ncbi:MAG: hypothetical protein K2L96_00385 [Muribaculaceae bacterium]|nr:hypothetical protein [Muribaculaceae bacterium]
MIESITTGPKGRASNFELLRLLAMFFVLVVHADFAALDVPKSAELHASPLGGAMRVAFESLAIVSVNIFILISGWFGIRASVKGFLKLLFQVAFTSFVVYLCFVAFGNAPFTGEEVIRNLVSVWAHEQWFVMSYMVLFVLAPVLNAYVEKSDARSLGGLILAFYALQTLATMAYESLQFDRGYSAVSFVGLYLVARWIRLYGHKLLSLPVGLLCVLLPAAISGLSIYFIIWNAIPNVVWKFLNYANPLVVVESVGYMILFARMKPFVNRVVNVLSSGCFAVYLLNMNPWIYIHFKQHVQELYSYYSGLYCIFMIGAFLLVFFLVSCVLDLLLRQPMWRAVSGAVTRSKQ